MADFQEHIKQAEKNLSFLQQVNKGIKGSWDWQVTISFYVGVHLINAHLAKADLHFRSHEKIKSVLNPENRMSISKLDEPTYLAYVKLQQLSRRSRYLCHDSPENASNGEFLTYDKHFSKSIRCLNTIISFMKSEYKINLVRISIDCLELKNFESEVFNVV